MGLATIGGIRFEWGAASRTSPGQVLPGDLFHVVSGPRGVLAVVVDGIGHGEEANAAAKAAIDVVKEHPHESAISLVQRCHKALRDTRGAVLTVAAFDAEDRTMTALGVGNVEAVLMRADPYSDPKYEGILLRSGLVGERLPALYASTFPVSRGDTLVLTTDGVREPLNQRLNLSEPVQSMADRILRENFKGNDDGLVLVIRYSADLDERRKPSSKEPFEHA